MFVHGCVCICLFNVCLCRYLTFTALIYECSVCTHSCFQSALNILQGRNKNPCIIVAATSRGLSNAERRPCRVQRHCHAGNGVVEEVQLSRWVTLPVSCDRLVDSVDRKFSIMAVSFLCISILDSCN